MNRTIPVMAAATLLVTTLVLTTRTAPAAQETPAKFAIPEQPFAELTGPYQVGVRDLFFVEEDRPEPFTSDPDDRRRLLVRAWYPASAGEDSQAARYVPDPAEFGDSSNFEAVKQVLTRGYADAKPDPSGGPYPVLLFNPGGGWTRLTDTFWTEQLASHGYVVFAVDHPGFNQTVVFPDGYRYAPDQYRLPQSEDKTSSEIVTNARALWAWLDKYYFPEWLADNVSLLDRIEQMAGDENDSFKDLLDLDNIGVFGWSFGGATAVQMSKADPRIKAAVDGDGQLFGDVAATGTQSPVLLLHSEMEPTEVAADASEAEKERAKAIADLVPEVLALDRSLKANSPQVWELTLRGSSHGSFSDLVLFRPAGPDQADPARLHAVINALSLAFFDRTLKGKKGALLDNLEAEIPEAYKVSLPGRP